MTFSEFTCEFWRTIAAIRSKLVHTCSVVVAWIGGTFIDVYRAIYS